MLLETIANGLGAGFGKFADWRAKKAEAKVKLAEIRANTEDASWRDELVTVVIMAVFVFIAIVLPVAEVVFGVNGGLADRVMDGVHRALEGDLGQLIKWTVWTAVGGGTLGATGKRLLKTRRK